MNNNIEEIASVKLMQLFPVPLNLAWHENRSSYFSCRRERRKIHLRLHKLFAKAPSPVLEAVVGYAMKGDKRAGQILRQMANLYFAKKRVEPDPLNAKGRVYDLEALRDDLKEKHFPKLDVSIGWSTVCRPGSFKCVTFGSYDRLRNQIRINPILDDREVPLFFLKFILFHEMCHAICPPRIDANGAVYSHTKEFHLLEKEFPQFEEAKAWEKQSLKFLKKRFKKNGRA